LSTSYKSNLQIQIDNEGSGEKIVTDWSGSENDCWKKNLMT